MIVYCKCLSIAVNQKILFSKLSFEIGHQISRLANYQIRSY
jgi:hypothetical protein